MFNKKSCPKCSRKINRDFDFCPSCGFNLTKKKKENSGMLGTNDLIEENLFNNLSNSFMGNGILNKMMGNALKMLEKEMQNAQNLQNNNLQPGTNFELIINGKRIDPKNIKVTRKPQKEKNIKNVPEIISKKLPKDILNKISKLKQIEPGSNVRRLSNQVIYEINLPDVKSIDDVSIRTFENSIEIKALGKDKAYSKVIPVSLPLQNYKFNKGKLILELGVKD